MAVPPLNPTLLIQGGVPAVTLNTAVNPSGNVANLGVDSNGNLLVNVTNGGSGGTSSTDEATFTAGASAGTPLMGVINPIDTPSNGVLAIAALDGNRNIKVNVVAGGSGGGAVTIANGADVCQGSTTDAAVVGDNTGTLSGKLRGLTKIFNSVWSAGNNWLQISVQNATLAVTQSGNWSATVTQATPGNLNATTTGSKASNNAAPSSNLNEVMGVVANAAAQTWTEGYEVQLSSDLKGNLRTKQTGSSFTYNQVTVGNNATQIITSNNNRTRLTVTNTGNTVVYFGDSGVTTSSGDYMPGIAGYPKVFRTTAAVYGIAASGNQTVTYFEEVA